MAMSARARVSDLTLRLHTAIELGNVHTVERVLEICREYPQHEGVNLGPGLCQAIQAINVEIILLLLRGRADVRYTSDEGKKPIHYAALSGSLEVLKLIVGAGSAVNAADSAGKTALHFAVEAGDKEMAQYLLQQGANVTRSRSYLEGESPLHTAAKMGRTEIVRMLLARGGYLNLKSRKEATALHLAVRGKYLGVVTLLCEAGANLEEVNEKGQTALLIAVENSGLLMVRTLLTFRANPNARDMRGRSAMHYLGMVFPCSEGHIEMAKLLIAAGMEDANTEDVDRYTPLHYAAFKGSKLLVNLLLDNGADVNKYYIWRLDTPLNMAISNKQVEIVKLLVERGADVTMVDGPLTKVTPLHKVMVTRMTRQEDKLFLTELLISRGAKLNVKTAREHSPLEDCVFFSAFTRDASLPVLMKLVSSGAKHCHPTNARTDPKNSPLCWLTWHGNLQAAKFLVSIGWDLQNESWIWLPGKDEESSKFLHWLQELVRKPKSLKQICRSFVRSYLVVTCSQDTDISPYVAALPLPGIVKRFLMLVPEIEEYSSFPVNVMV